MRQLLNQCLVLFRREQAPKPEQPIRTEQEYRAAVAALAKQLKQIL